MKTMIGQEGKSFPLGATLVPGGANFSPATNADTL
jgi:hypothetical protein